MNTPVEGPSLSVVIPTLNEERHVGSLIPDYSTGAALLAAP